MITILDYGMANLRSVQKAFEAVGATAIITADVKVGRAADRLVLPGVGAFRDAIAKLNDTGLADVVKDHIARDKPFLGICLGLQLLFDRSFEDGVHAGLGIFRGDVVKFPDRPGLKVPHMGWNTLKGTLKGDRHNYNCACPLLDGLPAEPAVYFVHSYYAVPRDPELMVATADYPGPFTAAIARGNTFATQFHPEKSQAVGLKMLANFAKI